MSDENGNESSGWRGVGLYTNNIRKEGFSVDSEIGETGESARIGGGPDGGGESSSVLCFSVGSVRERVV